MRYMKEKLSPGILGCMVSLLLIASFFITRLSEGNKSLSAVNTLLVIIAMCMDIHLVRRTSALNNSHVWDDTGLIFVWFIPVFNLLVTAMQFVGGIFSQLFSGYFFTLIMVLCSLPVFFAFYYLYVSKKVFHDKTVFVITVVLLVLTFLYLVLRVCDKVIFPICESNGKHIAEAMLRLSGISSIVSLLMEIVAFTGFVVLSRLFIKDKKEKNEENNA